ncbi:MAG: ATP-grasp domain-containing protein [Streptosporangiaceae bacterium]
MTTTRVMILETAGPESAAIVAAAVAAGHQVHAVTQTGDPTNADIRHHLSGCLRTDFSQPEQALTDIVGYARRIGANAVLTTNEYLTPLLAEVCATLGLPGNDPDRASAARSKATMSQAFTRAGVTAPRTHAVDSQDDLLDLLAAGRIAFPCVIKPAAGAGSAGITVATTAAQAIAAYQSAAIPRGMYGMALDPQVLIQDYVHGTEYSVESITQHGTSTHLCVTRKTLTPGAHRVEVGHALPAALPPDLERAVIRQVDLAIAAVGIRNGASHTEVILTPTNECMVIEIGARIGAGQIGFLIHHALGIDPWTACLDIALDRPAQLTATRADYATVRFLTSPRPGRLVTLTGLPERNARVPMVRLRTSIGDTIRGTADNAARLGSFVVVGSDPKSVDLYADHLLSRVRIETDPVDTSHSNATTETADAFQGSRTNHS